MTQMIFPEGDFLRFRITCQTPKAETVWKHVRCQTLGYDSDPFGNDSSQGWVNSGNVMKTLRHFRGDRRSFPAPPLRVCCSNEVLCEC